MKLPIQILTALMLAFAVAKSQQAPQIQLRGSIQGIITGEDNLPIGGALIRAFKIGGPQSTLLRYVTSDGQGHYVIDRLEWGSYRLFTKKEEAGYADTSWTLFAHDTGPIVTLSPAGPQAKQNIQLGPRAGRITGLITDAASGSPVSTSITLSRLGEPESSLSQGANPGYSILVPSLTNVEMEVHAGGYQTYHYSGALDPLHRKPLNLKPGEELVLNIQIQPARKPSK